jgi:hypothetical protein
MIDLHYLPEPKLQFGQFFEHEDSKTGLAEFGPFGKNVQGLHPSEIKLAFVGTGETIAGAQDWVRDCGAPIESENTKVIKAIPSPADSPTLWEEDASEDDGFVRVYKILNRDFPGFSSASQFNCQFQMNPRWDRLLRPADIDPLLKIPDKKTRIDELVKLFDDQIRTLAQTPPAPTVILVALTPEIEEQAEAVRISGNFFMNFRRALKARAMKWGIPTQLIQRSTVLGKRSELQEKATRAWNFCTALYYKADGVPWRPTTLPSDVCYVGIDFYVARDVDEKLTMRSSVAQAFDHLGQGVVLRGDPFEWNEFEQGRSPHMTGKGAKELIRRTLDEYVRVRGSPPRRVVIHKSSRFWGKEHDDHNELDGLYEGIYEVFPRCDTDFVALSQSGVRLFREGIYPPMRGTHLTLGGDRHFLYTMGYIPYLETYPGSYVPEPWEMVEHHGGCAARDLLQEVLALTKMNVNNCSFADGVPITLAFSHKVGEIMKHIQEGDMPQSGYKFYM